MAVLVVEKVMRLVVPEPAEPPLGCNTSPVLAKACPDVGTAAGKAAKFTA